LKNKQKTFTIPPQEEFERLEGIIKFPMKKKLIKLGVTDVYEEVIL